MFAFTHEHSRTHIRTSKRTPAARARSPLLRLERLARWLAVPPWRHPSPRRRRAASLKPHYTSSSQISILSIGFQFISSKCTKTRPRERQGRTSPSVWIRRTVHEVVQTFQATQMNANITLYLNIYTKLQHTHSVCSVRVHITKCMRKESVQDNDTCELWCCCIIYWCTTVNMQFTFIFSCADKFLRIFIVDPVHLILSCVHNGAKTAKDCGLTLWRILQVFQYLETASS